MPNSLKNKTEISICIATYNVEKYIIQCLDSIVNVENDIVYEIIIVDDCSNDKTVDNIKKWISKNKNIIVNFRVNKRNLWPGWTYDIASKLARSPYITFLDSDDYLIKKTFKNKINLLKTNEDLKVIYWNGLYLRNEILTNSEVQPQLHKYFKGSLQTIRHKLFTNIPMCSISCAVIKKSFFDKIWGFDNDLLSNDYLLNVKIRNSICNKDKEVFFEKTPCFAYRIQNESISHNNKRMNILVTQVIERYCKDIDLKKKIINKFKADLYYQNSIDNINNKRYKKWIENLKLAITYNFKIVLIIRFIFYTIFPKKVVDKIIKIIPNKIKSYFNIA